MLPLNNRASAATTMLSFAVLAFGALLLLGGCPRTDKVSQDPDPKVFEPSAPIPGDDPLTLYDKLWLGMNAYDVSQQYNAPSGQGTGFSRVIEDYGAIQNHLISFNPVNPKKPEKTRGMVLRMYRDVLCVLVERREGLTAAEAEAWRQELVKKYGDKFEEIIPGAQWSWGSGAGVLLTFTQDNGPEGDIKANVVLEHKPTLEASREYARAYEKVHPTSAPEPGS